MGSEKNDPWPGRVRFIVNEAGLTLVVGLVVAIGSIVGAEPASRAALSCSSHGMIGVELAGTAARSKEALSGCSAGAVRSALQWDLAFIAWYVVWLVAAVWFVSRAPGGRIGGGYRLSALQDLRHVMIAAAFAVGALDLLEDLALHLGVHGSEVALELRPWAALAAASAGWPKFMLAFVVVAYIVVGLVGWITMPPRALASGPVIDMPRDDPAGDGNGASAEEKPLGISLSGGGVRAATFALGVLQVLDREGFYRRAR